MLFVPKTVLMQFFDPFEFTVGFNKVFKALSLNKSPSLHYSLTISQHNPFLKSASKTVKVELK